MYLDRQKKIIQIEEMLNEMSDEQINNVHVYTTDEYKEPNHEAVALDAIVKLSRKYGQGKEEVTHTSQPENGLKH